MTNDLDKGFHYSYLFNANICNKCREVIKGPPAIHLNKCQPLKKGARG